MSSLPTAQPNASADRLRSLLRKAASDGRPIVMPTCGDGLGARLIEAGGFELQFLAGYALAATYGLPDVEYLGCSEVASRIQAVTAITSLPLIADGDTGYGNAMTIRRTVQAFARAGAAGIMIEDQRSPKRCGHTEGRQVVSRDEALLRVRAVIDSRREGLDILLVARCDARVISFDECLERCVAFAEMGAELIFAEAIPSVDELRRFASEMRRRAPNAILMVNSLEGGKTPNMSADAYAKLGYTVVAYPLTMLMATINACRTSLSALRDTSKAAAPPMTFAEVCTAVGFDEYFAQSERYANAESKEGRD